MNTIETPITKEKVAALVADAFQDSEYFLPKIALQDQLGLDVEVISLKRDPIEIYSNWSPPFAAARCWSRSPLLPRVAT